MAMRERSLPTSAVRASHACWACGRTSAHTKAIPTRFSATASTRRATQARLARALACGKIALLQPRQEPVRRLIPRVIGWLIVVLALALVAGWFALRGSLPRYDGRVIAA